MTRNVPSPEIVSITVIRMAVGAAAGSERLRYANTQGGALCMQRSGGTRV
jgi:hypothetical protein